MARVDREEHRESEQDFHSAHSVLLFLYGYPGLLEIHPLSKTHRSGMVRFASERAKEQAGRQASCR